MIDIEQYQDNLSMLLEQHYKVSKMSQDKQQKYLPKLDSWIKEINEVIENDLKDSYYINFK